MKRLAWKRIHAFLLAISMIICLCGFDRRVEASETGQADEAVMLTVPQNVREENGFIVWDEVENAYGYTIQASKGEETWEYNWYENKTEWSRFIYEHCSIPDFGDYTFKVCAFDNTGVATEFSSSVIVSYQATFPMPENVRVPDGQTGNGQLEWDEVEGAVRYNIRIYENDGKHSLYGNTYSSYNSFGMWHPEEARQYEYWITVQAMDEDYNVSEWTEEVLVKFIVFRLATPQNVRFDESGENIIWDKVEGADYYYVMTNSFAYELCEQPILENWKRYIYPWLYSSDYEGKSYIQVYAGSNSDYDSSNWSDALEAKHTPTCDESITVPQIKHEDDYITWEQAENTFRDLCRIKINEDIYDTSLYESDYTRNFWVNRYPEGDYEIELCVIDGEGKYNTKAYPLTLNTAHDESVWVPKLYHKFDTLLWDYDRLRHPDTNSFWVRIRNQKDGTVAKLAQTYDGSYYELISLKNGDYIVDACVIQNDGTLGNWSEPMRIQKHGDGLFDEENETTTEVETPPEATGVPEDDRITSITINPAFNMKHKDDSTIELDLSKIKIKAKEIYDEEGLKRAEAALGETLKGNKHYNLLDLTLLYDGKDFSNSYEGLVKVIIPLPKGHQDKKFSCYRLTEVNGKLTKEHIPGEQTEDSYIIYLEHFSEYALVAGDEGPHTHEYSTDWKSDATGHWKECSCEDRSEESAHTSDAGTVTKMPTAAEKGIRTYKCSVCGYVIKTEEIPRLSAGGGGGGTVHTHEYSTDWKSDATGHWRECTCKAKTEESTHTPDAGTVTKEPTMTETGTRTYKCSVCGYVIKTEEIAKLSGEEEPHTHVYSTDWKSDAAGHWRECACKAKAEEGAHTQDAGTVTKEATATEAGIRTYKCSVCGYVIKTEEIAKLPAEEEPENKDISAETKVTKEQKKKNELIINKKISSKINGNTLAVAWNKLPGADGYDIYAAPCDAGFKGIATSASKNKTSVTIRKISGKKINGKKNYQAKVKAYRLLSDGKKQYIGTSAVMHVAGSQNKTNTNAKNISLKKKTYALKKGKSAQIRATVIKADKKKKLLSKTHGAKLSYVSSDEAVATVTASGKIKAKKRGKCTIYVRALNGISKKVKVTVN